MFCPDCGAEYRREFTTCAECGVSLVDALPAENRPDPDSKIVPVFRTGDPMRLPFVKSLLDSAGIEYFVQGEEALGLWPVGAMGSSANRAGLGAVVHVFERDAAVVGELLTEIGETEELGRGEEE